MTANRRAGLGADEAEMKRRIDAFVEKWPQSPWGPGHIVLDDLNIGEGAFAWCISLIDGVLDDAKADDRVRLQRDDYLRRHSREELEETREFLQELLTDWKEYGLDY